MREKEGEETGPKMGMGGGRRIAPRLFCWGGMDGWREMG
jgi:hypothetical protein